jgi:predicted  nucleic acid-binding Zn-ribbon protein
LAAKIGKDLQPSAEKNCPVRENSSSNGTDAVENHDIPMKPKKSRASKTDVDTERLLSNLENETQHVSKKIMALAGDIERMRSLLNDENSMFSCMSYFSNILTGTGEAKHQRLTDRSDSVNYEVNNTGRFV